MLFKNKKRLEDLLVEANQSRLLSPEKRLIKAFELIKLADELFKANNERNNSNGN
ncbi:MAG: hypothetical protein ACTSW1_17450 [Candidatus Hodarchaeales archaeon]